MRTIEYVRLGWVLGTGAGMGLVASNLREAMVDLWALNQSTRQTVQVLQIQARGTVWDQLLKIAAMSCLFGIGVAAVPGRQPSHRRYLFSVVLMLLNGGCLVSLSWMQNRRRHLISEALRLRRVEPK